MITVELRKTTIAGSCSCCNSQLIRTVAEVAMTPNDGTGVTIFRLCQKCKNEMVVELQCT